MKLPDLDKVYSVMKDCMTVQERVNYCVKLIYDLHGQLNRHTEPLSAPARSRSLVMLQEARAELHMLMTQGIV
jgi:hypothetical protein